MKKTIYEWDWEELDKHGDIIDHGFVEKPCDNPFNGRPARLVLVKDVWRDDGNLMSREWAYAEEGKLPKEFDGGSKVPQKYHDEFEKWAKTQS